MTGDSRADDEDAQPGEEGEDAVPPLTPGERAKRYRELALHTPEQEWSALAHFGVLVGVFIPMASPLAAVLALGIKGRNPFIRLNALEAINLGINFTVLQVALLFTQSQAWLPSIVAQVALLLVSLVVALLAILAGIRTLRGVAARYPVPLRLLRRGG